MTGSSFGIGRSVSVSSESTQGCESDNGNKLALDLFSKLDNFVNKNSIKNGNKIWDITKADSIGAAPSTTESMTAAALLWGRGPTTTAPLTTSSSASTSSHWKGSEHTKSNSPASNAAAALLVGMSMRKERAAKTLQATKTNLRTGASAPVSVFGPADKASKSVDDSTIDVETKWREIHLEISKQSQLPSSGEAEQKEGLEVPKGVTRRPSGAWQAQIYFAGKTRYIGVWEKPQQAATAYNLAKFALKDLKAQQKSFRKRTRNHPGTIDTKVGFKTTGGSDSAMATPCKESESQCLPPSITWPSSASSSSTISSGGFRSPSYSRGPFKKRKGEEVSPEQMASFERPSPLSTQQQQQQGSVQATGPLPLPRGHPYSAFSQQFRQQHMGGPGGNPLTHPALQLLSLRPPQQSLWMHPQPPQYHIPQQYHHHPNTLQQFPYSQATMANNNIGRNHPVTSLKSESEGLPAAKKGRKKGTKNKRYKQSSSKKTKPSKAAGNNSSQEKDQIEKDAQNQKWKTIRVEVVALFNEYKRLDGKKDGDINNSKPTKTFDKDVLRGITVRPSGKFQAQLYFGGRSRYIGVFDSEYEAASAYEMIRSRLKNDPKESVSPSQSASSSMASLTSSSSFSSTVSFAQGCKEGKDAKATDTAASTTTTMRSITPSPTPRNDVHCKVSANILTT